MGARWPTRANARPDTQTLRCSPCMAIERHRPGFLEAKALATWSTNRRALAKCPLSISF